MCCAAAFLPFIAVIITLPLAFMFDLDSLGTSVLMLFDLIAVFGIAFWIMVKQGNKQNEEEVRMKQEIDDSAAINMSKYKNGLSRLSEKYGEPDLIIDVYDSSGFEERLPKWLRADYLKDLSEEARSKYIERREEFFLSVMDCVKDIDRAIIVYEKTEYIRIMGWMFRFEDIVSCKLSDNTKTLSSASVVTDTSDMIGRAVVGNLIAGSAGAVIGGTSADKNVSITGSTVHDYTIDVVVNDLSTPVIRINVGSDEDTASRIMGMIKVIVKRNKR